MMSSSTRGWGCGGRLDDDLGNLETGGEDVEDEVEERPPPPPHPLQCSGVSSTRVVDAAALDVDDLGILGAGLADPPPPTPALPVLEVLPLWFSEESCSLPHKIPLPELRLSPTHGS